MTSHDHDLPFLTEAARVLDDAPRADVSPESIAATLGIDNTTAEQVTARLLRGQYLEKCAAPRRYGDGPLQVRLDLTERGWQAAAAQRL